MPVKIRIAQMQPGIERSTEELALNIQPVQDQCKIIMIRCESIQFQGTVQTIHTIAHFTRKLFYCHFIPGKNDLRLHIRDRLFQFLELHRAGRDRHITINQGMCQCAMDLQFAIGISQGPIHVLRQGRQQRQVGLIQVDSQLDLFLIIQPLITAGCNRPQWHNALGRSRTIIRTDQLLHRELFYIDQAILQMENSIKRIKGRPLYTAIFRCHGNIRRWIIRIAAKIGRHIRSTSHSCIDPSHLRKHPGGQPGCCQPGLDRTIQCHSA